MDPVIAEKLWNWAERYNNPRYFEEDPIAFPRRFAAHLNPVEPTLGFGGEAGNSCLQDVEIAAVFAAHLAWGRRAMIVRDCSRLFDEMMWKPYDYVMAGDWRSDNTSLHRTVKWSEIAKICRRLKEFYAENESLEILSAEQMRTRIYGQKEDPKAANKKIWMLRRWMVRDDGKVDLGLWKNCDKRDLVIPLDVHVYRQAVDLGLTKRRAKDIVTARDITDSFREIFPDDPAKGDFALFGYGVNNA
ncbi:MAG: DUF2400 domain-containing protein [Bacteroidales bacterium]|nr:DUF2400 domain-containing protein [Bacteroidales bacterium]